VGRRNSYITTSGLRLVRADPGQVIPSHVCAFDRVLIFPTKPMLRYIKTRNPSVLKTPTRLYVGVTRARHSSAG
jgi:hypothetical protein